MVAAALAVVAPALRHGASLGPYDLLSQFGLTARAHVVVHNHANQDQIDEIIPWVTLAWEQVHHGHLPLWNPFSLLGLPLAFNWQSGAFSLQALLGYLSPLRLAYTVQVVTTVVIAGTGAYLLARVLRLGALAAVLVGVVFELSGPMMAWLGWPITSVMAWTGWLFAAGILVVRGTHRARSVVLLAAVSAASVYAGQPDTLVVLVLAFLVFVAALLLLRLRRVGGEGGCLAALLRLLAAGVVGAALAAPLALPGAQLLSGSVRNTGGAVVRLQAGDALHLVFATFDGPATQGFYGTSAAYVGVVALVLAAVGAALRWRRREVAAVLVVLVVGVVVVFVPGVLSPVTGLHDLDAVKWTRFLAPIALMVAVLAGFGLDGLVHSDRQRSVRRWLAGGFGAAAVVLVALWSGDRHAATAQLTDVRSDSFVWPVVGTVVGLAAVALLWWDARRPTDGGGPDAPDRDGWRGARLRRVVAVVLVAVESAFLVAVGAPPLSSSPSTFTVTPQVRQLQQSVGGAVVGFGTGSCLNFLVPQVGILQEANDAFGVREFAAYDPVMPAAYPSSWRASTGTSGLLFTSLFCPRVADADLARAYGVGFVLELHGYPGPPGGIFDRSIGREDLYRIPGASAATLVPLGAGGSAPPAGAPGRSVAVSHPDPASWRVVTDAPSTRVLRLRLTDVPGWTATVDGHPLALHPFLRVMLQARLPPGRHVVVVRYWPATFSIGLALAAAAVVVLVAVAVLALVRVRRPVPRPAVSGTGAGGPPPD